MLVTIGFALGTPTDQTANSDAACYGSCPGVVNRIQAEAVKQHSVAEALALDATPSSFVTRLHIQIGDGSPDRSVQGTQKAMGIANGVPAGVAGARPGGISQPRTINIGSPTPIVTKHPQSCCLFTGHITVIAF
ncbi:hypothetical protein H4Q26_011732 [Puccinia striiformis f. sp. tritici PST-130]|nr:hypothetical protein H4Q26_011732 [Puccinia striiformis f. sp. tritici PST-130]